MDVLYLCCISAICLLGLTADTTVLNHSSNTKWLFKRQISECSGSEYFLCKSGECLTKYNLCDSFVDCADKSDEAAIVCQALYKGRCQSGQWRCTYGACLKASQRCDQKVDCWDASDEAQCPPQLSTNKPCKVPVAQNSLFYSWSHNPVPKIPGSTVQHNDLIQMSTNVEHYSNEGEEKGSFFICNNGVLSPHSLKSTNCPVTNNGTAVHTGIAKEPKYHIEASKQLNWFDASMECHRQNRRLAVVTSQEENDILVEAIEKALPGMPEGVYKDLWIGGTDMAKEGQWSWFPTGKTFKDYDNWGTGQPDNNEGKEHCIHYWIRKTRVIGWNDWLCDQPLFYICEDLQ